MAKDLSPESVDTIVVHCSATKPSHEVTADDIDQWHKERGWSGIGYHLVILRDGATQFGRPFTEQGAHVAGHNDHTVGICMVGGISEDDGGPEDNFTAEQYASLIYWRAALLTAWPDADWCGHRDFPGVNKACPCFDVREWCGAEYVL